MIIPRSEEKVIKDGILNFKEFVFQTPIQGLNTGHLFKSRDNNPSALVDNRNHSEVSNSNIIIIKVTRKLIEVLDKGDLSTTRLIFGTNAIDECSGIVLRRLYRNKIFKIFLSIQRILEFKKPNEVPTKRTPDATDVKGQVPTTHNLQFNLIARQMKLMNTAFIEWDRYNEKFQSLEAFLDNAIRKIPYRDLGDLYIYLHFQCFKRESQIFVFEGKQLERNSENALRSLYLDWVIDLVNYIIGFSSFTFNQGYKIILDCETTSSLNLKKSKWPNEYAKQIYKGRQDMKICLKNKISNETLQAILIEMKNLNFTNNIYKNKSLCSDIEIDALDSKALRQLCFYQMIENQQTSLLSDLASNVLIKFPVNELYGTVKTNPATAIHQQVVEFESAVDICFIDTMSSSSANGISVQSLMLMLIYDMIMCELSKSQLLSKSNVFGFINRVSNPANESPNNDLLKLPVSDLKLSKNMYTCAINFQQSIFGINGSELNYAHGRAKRIKLYKDEVHKAFEHQRMFRFHKGELEIKERGGSFNIQELTVKDSKASEAGGDSSFISYKIYDLSKLDLDWVIENLTSKEPKLVPLKNNNRAYKEYERMVSGFRNELETLERVHLFNVEDNGKQIFSPTVLKYGVAKFVIEGTKNAFFGPYFVLRYQCGRSFKPLTVGIIKSLEDQVEMLHQNLQIHHNNLCLANLFCSDNKVFITNFEMSSRIENNECCAVVESEHGCENDESCYDHKYINDLYKFSRG